MNIRRIKPLLGAVTVAAALALPVLTTAPATAQDICKVDIGSADAPADCRIGSVSSAVDA